MQYRFTAVVGRMSKVVTYPERLSAYALLGGAYGTSTA